VASEGAAGGDGGGETVARREFGGAGGPKLKGANRPVSSADKAAVTLQMALRRAVLCLLLTSYTARNL
jgi:hypothetical protein